jgi:hypothetical protein
MIKSVYDKILRNMQNSQNYFFPYEVTIESF